MSQPSCDACTNLRDYAPEFVMSGVTENVGNSLKNNTGLNAALTVLHNNCEDLNDVNDCLIGRLGQELESYDVCDWKDLMAKLLPNLYETLKAMIMSECGLWCRIASAASVPKVTYVRANGDSEVGFWWTPSQLQQPLGKSVEIYMDSVDGDDGSIEADRDYLCIVTLCCNVVYDGNGGGSQILFTTSSETITEEMFEQRAQHSSIYASGLGTSAIPATTACFVPRGQHIVLSLRCPISGQVTRGRLHQIIVSWIPVVQTECYEA